MDTTKQGMIVVAKSDLLTTTKMRFLGFLLSTVILLALFFTINRADWR